MNTSLINKSAQIFGGSAIASMGFSFGRDIYKDIGLNKKENREAIIGMIILVGFVAAIVLGTYSAGILLTRNYPSKMKAIFIRMGSMFMLIPSGAILLLIGIMIASLAFRGQPLDTETDSAVPYEVKITLLGSILPLSIFSIGLIKGRKQRKTRLLAWEAKKANKEFMKNHSLIENDDGTILDESTSQNYRIEGIESSMITLFPIGRRGKRAYIQVAEDGKYTVYTGMVHM